MFFLYLTTMTIGMMFFYMIHPITMGISIIVYVIPMAILIGMNSKNFWYSYIIILIYLGGLLILFLYITSMASNEKILFKISWNYKILFIIIMMIPMLTMLFNQMQNIDSIEMMNLTLSNPNYSYSSLFSKNTGKTTIFLASYLLLCLISVVKICQLITGPIRESVK